MALIARSVGYTSEYAFNRAFARIHHIAPPATVHTTSGRPPIPRSDISFTGCRIHGDDELSPCRD